MMFGISLLLMNIIKIVGVLLVTWILLKNIEKILTKIIVKIVITGKDGDKIAEGKKEKTLIKIGTGFCKVLIYIFLILTVLQILGVPTAPLIALTGIAGIAFGFGGQYLIKDIVNGLFILLENQYRIEDVIKIGTTIGTVENITLRITTLRDVEGCLHYIPNGDIATVSNYSKKYSVVNLEIGVGYDTDINKVEQIINKVGIEISKDAEWKGKITTPPKFVRIQSFGDSAINIKISGEVGPSTQWAVAGELRRRIKEAFDKEAIEIPFPHRVLINKK